MEVKVNKVVSGMVKDSWSTNESQYLHALNAITESLEGDRYVLTNEASNNLATLIPEGFKVIGKGREYSTENLYLLITNPKTKESQVGKITLRERPDTEDLDDSECFECGTKELGKKLEDEKQIPYLKYETILEDSCLTQDKRFNFDINYPVKNIVFKREGSVLIMYFTDGLNPPRYIELSNIEKYFTIEISCGDNEITNCPDISKMKIFKDATPPIIEIDSIAYGGNLPESTYQYFTRYCDKDGNGITEVMAYTEDIRLFNQSMVTRSPDENTQTNYAIKLKLENLDPRFTHYKVIVRTAVPSTITNGGYMHKAYELGVFPVDRKEVTHYTNNLVEVSEAKEIYSGRRYVKTTDVLESSNKRLIHSGIREQEAINLQPVVNLIGQFAKWRTYIAEEDFYKDSKNESTFVGYQRDEVVPLAIRFKTNFGYTTATMPLISRLPNEEDLKFVTEEKGLESFKNREACNTTDRVYNWQFHNTAKETETVCIESVDRNLEYVEVEEVIERTCTDDEVAKIDNGKITINLDGEYYDFETFVEEIMDSNERVCNLNIEGPNGKELCELLFKDYPISDKCHTDELFKGMEYRVLSTTKLSGLGEIKGIKEELVQEEFPEGYFTSSAPRSNSPLQRGLNADDRSKESIPVNVRLGLLNYMYYRRTKDRYTKWRMYVVGFVRNTEDQSTACSGAEDADQLIEVNSTNKRLTNNMLKYYIRELDGEKSSTQIEKEMWSNKRHNFPEPQQTNGEVQMIIYTTTKDGDENQEIDEGSYKDYMNGVRGNFTLKKGNNIYNTGAVKMNDALGSVANKINDMLLKPLGINNAKWEKDQWVITGNYNGPIPEGFEVINESVGEEPKDNGQIHIGFYGAKEFEGNKVSNNASWVKILPKLSRDQKDFVVDISPNNNTFLDCNEDFFNKIYNDNKRGTTVKISVFLDCTSDLAVHTVKLRATRAVSFKFTPLDNNDLMIEDTLGGKVVVPSGVRNGGYFICVDTGMMKIPYGANESGGYIGYPSLGFYSVTWRPAVYSKVNIDFDRISINQETTYTAMCKFMQPVLTGCNIVPDKIGDFAYWESVREYPDNKETYNSKVLNIEPSDIPDEVRKEFEAKFTEGINDGKYVLNSETDFRCKPIRHFKMPDNEVAPILDNKPIQPFANTVIKVLGISLNEQIIESMLKVAVKNKLITKEFKDSIISYEVLRGDLTLERSVRSAGLLYDLRNYTEGGNTIYYPNYPYNSFEKDLFNNIEDKTLGVEGSRYTYHSPETDYNKETKGTEISLQGYQYGHSRGTFQEVEDHPKWVILSKRAFKSASNLAKTEVAFELLIQSALAMSNGVTGFFVGLASGTILPINSIIAGGLIVGAITQAGPKIEKYRLQWLQTYEDLGTPINYAYYYYSIGKYGYMHTNKDRENKLRSIDTNKYIGPGRLDINNPVTGKRILMNSKYREHTTFIDVGDYKYKYNEEYSGYDKSSNASLFRLEKGSYRNGLNNSVESTRNIASAYVYLKDYLPEQHGELNSISWKYTGFTGDLRRPYNCSRIFGGDTFIVRHSLKRKHAQFDIDYQNQADMTPIDYHVYNNIGPNPKYYVKFKANSSADSTGDSSDFYYGLALDNETSSGKYYVKPSKFYLYYYGIPYFLTESKYNTNFRTAGKEERDKFYPEYSDVARWTQQKNLNIQESNTFYYNFGLYNSKSITLGQDMLPKNFTFKDDKNDPYKPGMIMYSDPDKDIFGNTDPWLVYKPNNIYFSNTDWGKLQGVVGVENEAILGIYDLKSVLFNSVDSTIDTGADIVATELGDGKLFSRRIRDFSTSIGGYGGSQGYHSLSTEFGHFFVNNYLGEIYQMAGNKIIPISSQTSDGKPSNMNNWFKNNLPFQILKSNIKGISDLDIDNAYNAIGMTLGYDNRFKRLIITKRDFIPKVEGIEYIKKKGFFLNGVEIDTRDSKYFTDVSFTISYNLKKQEWSSFHSYKPDYYITDRLNFYTGKNTENKEKGIWVHNGTNKSYQVYYGVRYPFEVEFGVPRKNGFIQAITDINFDLHVYKYHNNFDKALVEGMFDKVYIYGGENNSGELRPTISNGTLDQAFEYPITAKDKSYQRVLVSRNGESNYTMNYFYDRTRHNIRNTPTWINHPNGIDKELNYKKVNFIPKEELTSLRLKAPIIRLIQDKESRLSYKLDLFYSKSQYKKE